MGPSRWLDLGGLLFNQSEQLLYQCVQGWFSNLALGNTVCVHRTDFVLFSVKVRKIPSACFKTVYLHSNKWFLKFFFAKYFKISLFFSEEAIYSFSRLACCAKTKISRPAVELIRHWAEHASFHNGRENWFRPSVPFTFNPSRADSHSKKQISTWTLRVRFIFFVQHFKYFIKSV